MRYAPLNGADILGDPTERILDHRHTSADGSVRDATAAALRQAVLTAGDATRVDRRVTITLSTLRGHGSGTEARQQGSSPFRWQPSFVRRSLGLAALAACAESSYRSPGQAVPAVADQAVTAWNRTGELRFHWEPWLAGLGPGGRAAVLAEAISWASALWSMVDWPRLAGRATFGGPDDRWTASPRQAVCLRGRVEVRLRSSQSTPRASRAGRDRDDQALISVAGGLPTRYWKAELGYLALVGSLRSPGAPAPSRVVGLWPASGQCRIVEVDDGLLHTACRLTVEVVEAWTRAELPDRSSKVAA